MSCEDNQCVLSTWETLLAHINKRWHDEDRLIGECLSELEKKQERDGSVNPGDPMFDRFEAALDRRDYITRQILDIHLALGQRGAIERAGLASAGIFQQLSAGDLPEVH